MIRKKIIMDTNNLISALGWNGNSKKLFNEVIDSKHDLVISVNQIKELKRVMEYPKDCRNAYIKVDRIDYIEYFFKSLFIII
jgi:predicted nucleic acid-binding protein